MLIATGGSATAEMAMKYSSFSPWLSKVWLAFMDESQQYSNYHEIAALAAIQQPALRVLLVTTCKHLEAYPRGGQQRIDRASSPSFRLRALNRPGDCLLPAQLTK